MYKRNRRIVAAVCVIFSILLQFICTFSALAADDLEEVNDEQHIIEEQTQSNEYKKIEEQLEKYSDNGIKELAPEFDPQRILKDAALGDFEFNLKGIINRAIMYFLKEIYINMNVLVKLIIIAIICAVLKNLQTSFLSDSVGELAFFTCYIVIVSILIVSFNSAMNLGRSIIDGMIDFTYATIPVLITLLVSTGNITSGGVFQPILILIIEIVSTVMRNVFIPLIFLSTILYIIDNISEKVQVSKLAKLLKQITAWSLGGILTVFITLVSLQGSLGAVIDGVTSKTAKFAISTFIPVAGSYLADAADTVIGCTLLIKNGAGIAVMLGIAAICIVPILKLLAVIGMFRITCVLIEPISEKRITNCINEIANSLTFLLGIVSCVAFMFFISITAVVGASNISAMIR